MDQLWFASPSAMSKLARLFYHHAPHSNVSTHRGVDTCEALSPYRLYPEGLLLGVTRSMGLSVEVSC